MLTLKDLGKRICDCEDFKNTQTYKEYIRESEKEFGMVGAPLNKFDDKLLNSYFEFINYLWEK